MIYKYEEFFTEKNNENYLLYYSFDWDDNILYMPTKIHMEHFIDGKWVDVSISTGKFSKVKNSKDWRLGENAFSEFKDTGDRGSDAFIKDVKKSIKEKKYGPSWDDFIEAITEGAVFSIITARGHKEETIRSAVEWIIDNVLDDEELDEMYRNLLKFSYLFKDEEISNYDKILRGVPSENKLVKNYLDNCDFIGVTNPKYEGMDGNVEERKKQALIKFKEKIESFAKKIGWDAIIGFSDDDPENIKSVADLIDNITNEKFSKIKKWVLKSTENPKNIKTKTKEMYETADQAPGLESSVLPFTTYANMTNRLYPKGPHNRQDDYQNQFRRQVNYLTKTSDEIFKDDKKKKSLKRKKKRLKKEQEKRKNKK